MRLCNDDITVFNALLDTDTGCEVYHGTIIRGCSWYRELASAIGDSGLKASNKITIRIPADADCSGKTYLSPLEYARVGSPDSTFTLKSGTLIVKGAAEELRSSPADLKKKYDDFTTVLGVTDNRRAPHAKHFKVVGA